MNCLSEEQLIKISRIVRDVEKLSDLEKLFLYLQLPCGRAEILEGNKYKSSNGNKCGDIFAKKPDQETTQTYTWILSHLEEDPNVSLPKQEVYDEYRAFCQASHFEPLCVADFGKAMKHAFPCIKPRRLGQRGNSRYCYSGLRKKYKIDSPTVPNILDCHISDHQQQHQPSQQHIPMSTNCCPTPNNANSSTSQHSPTNIKQEFKAIVQSDQQQQSPRFHYSPSHQQRRPFEAMNLKLKPMHHHHHGEHQIPSSNISPYSNGNHLTLAPNHSQAHQNHHQHGILAPSQHHSNQTGQEPQQNYHQLTVLSRPQAVPPTFAPSTSGMSYSSQQQQQYHSIQRPGTPDDDDYRHNYQDLHRPIVSAAIPFSQAMPAQMACIPSARLAPGTPFDYHRPSCCATIPSGLNDGQQQQFAHHHQQQQHQQQQHQHQQHQPRQEDDQQLQPQHQHGQYGTDSTSNTDACASASTSDLGQSSSKNYPHIRQSQRRPSPHHHPQHLRIAPAHLHLATNACGPHTSDLCASPFQSPASTPYPMIGSCGSACSSTGAGGGGGRSNNSPYLTTSPAAGSSTSQQQQSSKATHDYYSSPSTSAAETPAADCLQYSNER